MISTYQDYLQTNSNILMTKLMPNGLLKYKCPTCSQFKWAGSIVDVRNLSITEDWACDGCWTDWERKGRNIDGGEKAPEDKREWALRWAIAHNVSSNILQDLSMARRPDKYKKR